MKTSGDCATRVCLCLVSVRVVIVDVTSPFYDGSIAETNRKMCDPCVFVSCECANL